MRDPLVSCVMLTRGERPEMARLAVECFHAQTYLHKELIVYAPCQDISSLSCVLPAESIWVYQDRGQTIGELRNRANALARGEIIAHWDDDDWSAPERLAEQVSLLMSGREDAVGYRVVPFWKQPSGECWLYRNADMRYAIGSSLCYWRSAWKREKFKALPKRGTGEDSEWIKRVAANGYSAFNVEGSIMMLCRIHPGNTSTYSDELLNKSISWTRRPDLDYLGGIMDGN